MRELAENYILYVGNFYPHKNLKRLVLAFRKLIRETNADYSLVLVGGNNYSEEDKIIITGYVDDNRLNNLYRRADLYVFPSLYEGFGLPALEAMKRGVAVVSSNASCLPEILGDAAMYFNPHSIDDIAEKIKKVLFDKDLKNNLIKRGFERLRNYDWRKTAEETLTCYENIPQ
jgi:glycosyltransferase involved in cell wall biosynthesis